MKMVFIKFKPDGKEYGFGVPEDYKGSAGLKPGSWVRVPVPGCRKKMLRVVVRVAETETPPEGLKMIGYSGRQIAQTANKKARRAAHQGGIIYLAKKAKAEKRTMLGGRPIDLAWEAEKRPGLRTIWTSSRIWPRGTTPMRACPSSPNCAWGCAWALMKSATMTRPCRCTSSRSAASISCGIGPESGACCRPCTTRTLFTASTKTVAGTADRYCQRHYAGHLRPKAHQAAQVRSPCLAGNAPVPRSRYDRQRNSPLLGAGGQKLQEVRAAFLAAKKTDDGQ